jgi:hypothetical protein
LSEIIRSDRNLQTKTENKYTSFEKDSGTIRSYSSNNRSFNSRHVSFFFIAVILLSYVVSITIYSSSDQVMLSKAIMTTAFAIESEVGSKYYHNVDTSSYYSTIPLPDKFFSSPSSSTPAIPSSDSSTTKQTPTQSDFTTQAVLPSVAARQTNNIVNTRTYYDIQLTTATTGAIKRIEVVFPAGTITSGARLIEVQGIGAGSVSNSGTTVTYVVASPVSIPAGTNIRLEFGNIINPSSPSNSYTVTVTTRNSANSIIDGPTVSFTYTIKQIQSNDIANSAITSPKIADNSITSEKVDFSSNFPPFSRSTQTVATGGSIVPTSVVKEISGAVSGVNVVGNIDDGQSGQILILIGTSNERLVQINEGTNVQLPGTNAAFTLGAFDTAMFVFDIFSNEWLMVSFSNNSPEN